MTAYSTTVSTTFDAIAGDTVTGIRIAISPQSFEVRILQVEFALDDVGGDIANSQFGIYWTSRAYFTPNITRYASGTASAGTSVTPAALRHSAPACSALARTGTNVAVSGTAEIVVPRPIVSAPSQAKEQTVFTPPADITIKPGGVLVIQTGNIGCFGQTDKSVKGTARLSCYFEELRLSWPY